VPVALKSFFRKGNAMLKQRHSSVAGMLCAFLVCIQAPAQVISQANPAGESVLTHVNRQAISSRSGNSAATADLTHQLFTNAGIPTELADAFGFTDRIVQAEVAYRNGTHAAIHETDVVKAINNLTSTIGAPQWAHTSQPEIRKLRMHMLVLYPQLMASQDPPDTKGHRKAVSDNMRPIEASYLATALLYQKAFNSEYQFTDAERAQNMKLDAAAVNANHLARVQTLQDLLHGKTNTISVRDLLTASDHFFSDLGIAPATNLSVVNYSPISPISVTKGGRQ
jgi:hypothetical protein